MSVKIYENGAWRDASFLRKFDGNSWVDIDSGKRYENGQWVDVWSSTAEPGMVVFTESQTWTVPKGVKTIDVFLVGGGANTSENHSESDGDYYCCNGGNGGQTATYKNIDVTGLSSIPVVIGAGGSSTTVSINGTKYTARSGKGSGGGDGGYYGGVNGGAGGSDGGDGASAYSYINSSLKGSAGCRTTTRAFGESDGTLYSGGGGGGAGGYKGYGGAGGAGGGGAGAYYHPTRGTPNTGGGSGSGMYAGTGGSGVAIIRWGY